MIDGGIIPCIRRGGQCELSSQAECAGSLVSGLTEDGHVTTIWRVSLPRFRRHLPGYFSGFLECLGADVAQEERLGDGVVPAFSATAHARHQAVLVAEAVPIIATVLSALVRVNEDLALRQPATHNHQERIEDDVPMQ